MILSLKVIVFNHRAAQPFAELSGSCAINALTGKVGTGRKMSGYPTNQELASVFELTSRTLSVIHEASEYAVDTTSGIV